MKDLKEFWRKSQSDLIFTQATALAYTTLVALVPLLAVAFSIFKVLGGFEKLLPDITDFIEANLAPSFSDKISVYLSDIVYKVSAGTIGAFGLIGFMITAVTTLSTIEKTLNIIWKVDRQRSWSSRLTVYWTLLTMGPILIGVSIAFGSQAFAWLKADTGFIAQLLVIVFKLLPYLASGLLCSTLFFIIPNTQVNIKAAFAAGMATGISFELAKRVYSIYAKHMLSNESVYGTLSVVPIFLLWLYVAWLIILFGAELSCYLQNKGGFKPKRSS